MNRIICPLPVLIPLIGCASTPAPSTPEVIIPETTFETVHVKSRDEWVSYVCDIPDKAYKQLALNVGLEQSNWYVRCPDGMYSQREDVTPYAEQAPSAETKEPRIKCKTRWADRPPTRKREPTHFPEERPKCTPR